MSQQPLKRYAKDSYADQVQGLLLDCPIHSTCHIHYVAEQLDLDDKTLRSKLHEEGKTFREIAGDVLEYRAVELLQSTDLSLHEVSDRLGFSEPAVLCRLSKRRLGMTPMQIRLKLSQ